MGGKRRRKMGHLRRKRRKKSRKKIRRKKRKKIQNLCLILLTEGSLNCTLYGRMRRRLLFQAESTKSGTGVMTTGYCLVLCATAMGGGRTFRMIKGSQLLMSHSRWMWEKAIS